MGIDAENRESASLCEQGRGLHLPALEQFLRPQHRPLGQVVNGLSWRVRTLSEEHEISFHRLPPWTGSVDTRLPRVKSQLVVCMGTVVVSWASSSTAGSR